MTHANRGSILILSLWSVSILSIMLSSLAFQAAAHFKAAKMEMNQFRGHRNLISGLNLASLAIARDPEPHEDSPQDAWYGEIRLAGEWAERLKIRVEDEAAKIDLNAADEKLLLALLDALRQGTSLRSATRPGPEPRASTAAGPPGKPGAAGSETSSFASALQSQRMGAGASAGCEEEIEMDESGKDLVKAVLKWRSGKKNRRFDFLEELLLIEGIGENDFESLKPFLTVAADFFPRPVINVNTASPVVLKALLAWVPGDEFRKAEFTEKILELSRESPAGYVLSGELEPLKLMAKLKLQSTVEMTALLSQLVPYLTTDSSTFRIFLEAGREIKKAEIILRQGEDSAEPSVLWWHEE